MALTKTDICNLALSEIGNEANQITDFDTDTGKSARQCRLHYQRTLEELVRTHTWGCAKARIQLTQTVPTITSSEITDDFTYSSTINGKYEGKNVALSRSIRWNSTSSEWEYGTWSDPTFTATFTNPDQGNIPPETGWEAVTSGTLTLSHDYGFDWTSAYLLPSDCLRPLYFTNTDQTTRFYRWIVDWVVEGRTILTNYDEGFLLYLKEPSLAQMDSLFIRAFYTLLASKLAVPVAGDRQLRVNLLDEYINVIMPEARRVNGFEGKESPVVDSEWLEATNVSSSSLGSSWPPFGQSSYGTFNW